MSAFTLPSLPDHAALPPLRRIGKWLWLLPMAAALLFVLGILVWAYRAERAEQVERHATLIADALSTEAQIRARLEQELARVQEIAIQLPQRARNAAGLASIADVEQGLRGIWLSITWLDARGRTVADLPQQTRVGEHRALEMGGTTGLSAHLTLPVGGDRLVVRYSPALLLRRGAPWWLTRKYTVQLIDGSDLVVASVDEVPVRADTDSHDSYRVLVGSNMPGVYVELTLREPTPPFWRTVPLVLIGGFLLLMGVSSWLLRRQVRQVSLAEGHWRTEAAWRKAMEDSALVALRARDAQGRILYVNRTFCDMVGLPAERLLGLLPPMPYWPPEALEEVMQRNRRNLAGQAPRDGYETRWRHQDGRMLDVMVFESPLVDADGKQLGWMGSIIDITARKALEARERHQSEAMAHQARLTTLGEVASALAHQLNQPLTAVMSYNAGLQRLLKADPAQDPKLLAALQSQQEQANEAGRIVQRIREFLTRRAPQREGCDVGLLARRALALLNSEMKQRNVALEWNVATPLPAVFADMVLIEQVLLNLARNASDALAARPEGRRIGISIQASGAGFVKVDLHDNGPGLGGRTVEQLSAPFFSTKPEGMGMGLAICRSVIEAHHGGFDAGVGAWGGARFSFTLPVFIAGGAA